MIIWLQVAFKKPDNYRDFKYNTQGMLITQIFGQGFERFTGRKWADITLRKEQKQKKSFIYSLLKLFFGFGEKKVLNGNIS